MPSFKKQHYLPSVYLKHFAAVGPNAGRNSKVWRFDVKASRLVSVQSQCQADYFYSRNAPQFAEQTFQGMENEYAGIAHKIHDRKNPTEKEYFGLILMMLDLHIRNPVYANRTNSENIHAYNIRLQCVLNDILVDKRKSNPSHADLVAQLKQNWRVRILWTDVDRQLLASDNPALWFTLDESGALHFMILPISPAFCAFAFDNRRLVMNGDGALSDSDGALLNERQVRSASSALYSAMELTTVQQALVKDVWRNRTPVGGFVDDEMWSLNIVRATANGGFSFVQPA
jgi:hypothetical protein